MTNGWYPKYIKSLYNSTSKNQTIQLKKKTGVGGKRTPNNSIFLKKGKRTEQTFFQRRNADGQQAHEKMLSITNHHGNANQNHNEIPPHTSQNGCHQKD